MPQAAQAGPPWRAAADCTFAADRAIPDLPVSPWAGHRAFAYDLVAFLAPRSIVELGVHFGGSYFAFAQAIRDFALDCRILGVDTWRGDPHAGFYGAEVWDAFDAARKAEFPDPRFGVFRGTFDEALGEVADGSVDLLHIDGFHDKEAVLRDFASWLPKLASDAVVLMHDVADDGPYGSTAAWRELRRRHEGFDFQHSWGLGVLFPRGTAALRRLRAGGFFACKPLYEAAGRAAVELARVRRDLAWQAGETARWWRDAEAARAEAAWRTGQAEHWWAVAQDRAAAVSGPPAGQGETAMTDPALEALYARDVDCWDFGADTNSLAFAREHLGVRRPVGVNLEAERLDRIRAAGEIAVHCDVLRIPRPGRVRCVVLSHFVEHLPSLDACAKAIGLALASATEMVVISGPYFEDDDWLRPQGYKFNWGDWVDHTSRHSLSHVLDALRAHGADSVTVSLGFPCADTSAATIHAVDEAPNQDQYDPAKHRPKAAVALPRPAYQEFVVVASLDRRADPVAVHVARHGRYGRLQHEMVSRYAGNEAVFGPALHAVVSY